MSDNAKWYVVHTYSGYEKKVKTTIEKTVENYKLKDAILEISIPTEEAVEITLDEKTHANVSKTVERKLFPGYVLIRMVMTDESWHVVRNTRGVTGFVGPGSKPVALTDAEVMALGVEKHEVLVDYRVGDRVQVLDGPFKDFSAVVEDIDLVKGSVHIVVSFFSQETPVELDLNQVVLIS
jgi:transcriptional antiterminator NusG